jgi:hypothetical protein
MTDDQLPVMLQFLRVTIDASGELAVNDAAVGDALAQAPYGVIRDSRGRTYLLFGQERAGAPRRLAALRPERHLDVVGLVALWAVLFAAGVGALHWGGKLFPF